MASWVRASHGARSSSVSAIPDRILSMLAGGCMSSASMNRQPSASASARPTVVFPAPAAPMMVTIISALDYDWPHGSPARHGLAAIPARLAGVTPARGPGVPQYPAASSAAAVDRDPADSVRSHGPLLPLRRGGPSQRGPDAPACQRAARRADHRRRACARRERTAGPAHARRNLAGERVRALRARGGYARRAARSELYVVVTRHHRRGRPL